MEEKYMSGEVKTNRKFILVMMIAAVILMAASIMNTSEAHALSGSGTEEEPYEIWNADDWEDFAGEVRSGASAGRYYELKSDINIDMAVPVGTSNNPFKGHFLGGGKTVNANMSDTGSEGTALFRYIENAEITDLKVTGTIVGGRHAAGLTGFSRSENTLRNIEVSVTLNAGDYAGGIVGHGLTSNLTLDNCWFRGVINGGASFTGGLVGWSDGQTLTINNCLFSGRYEGSGKFHPIALRSPNARMNTHISGAYYASTAEPKDIDQSHNVTSAGVLVYAKADADVTVGHFYKAVSINGQNTQYYCPVSSLEIKMNKDFYQTSDRTLSYTVTVNKGKADEAVITKGTDYTADLAPADYPNIHLNEGQVLSQADQYMICVNGKDGYLGKWVSHFVVTSMKGSGSSSDPYTIGTELEWVQFTQILTSGSGYDFEDKALKLTADVVADRMAGSESHPFCGTFDGQNHKLSCTISESGKMYAAPFHYVKGAAIKNLTVEGTVVGGDHSAGLIGYTLGNKANVEDTNKIDRVTVATTSTSSDFGAGIVGYGGNSRIEITNTIFSGKVCCNLYNRRYTGAGIVGRNGGCALMMENCINKGSKGSKFVWWNPISLYTDGFASNIKTTYYLENVAKGDDYGTTSNVGGQLAYKSALSDRICEKVTAVDNVSYFVDPAAQIKDLKEVYAYTGSEITIPYSVVRSGNTVLVKNTDYTEKFNKTVKDRGVYTLTVTGKGKYTGSISKSFTVNDQLQGSGTEEDPYRIGSTSDWNILKTNVSSGQTYKNEFVRLTANVSIGNSMVGTADKPFCGTFDGQGHTLTAGISGKDESAAPFAYVNGATIKDLTVAGSVEGGKHTAGLVGRVTGGTLTVSKVEVKAVVRTYEKHLGGFIGHTVECQVVITDSVFSGEINFTSTEGYAGGFTGWSDKPIVDIDNCVFSGKVTGTVKFFHPAGIYYVGGTGYITGKTGVMYYTESGAQQGSEDGFARPIRDHDVAATRIYTRNETKDGSLYKALYLGGKKTEYYTKATISGVSTEPLFVNSDNVSPVEERYVDPSPKIRFDDDLNVGHSNFSITYYIDGEKLDYDEPVMDAGEYTVVVTPYVQSDYAGSVSTTFRVISFSGAGTEDDPYKILNEEYDWNDFREAISMGHTFKGEYVSLELPESVECINVTVPVGTTAHPFEGKFDGNMHELRVDLNDTSRSMAPFGAVANGAVIKNLNVTGTVSGGQHSGGLVGFAQGGRVEISNVHVSAAIPAGTYVGGIVGHGKESDLIIKDSSFSGKITGGSAYAGGLVGWSDGQKLTMEKCIFSGQYLGSGKFHPIAVRDSGKTMKTNIRRVYYLNTQGPTVENSNAGAAGTPVYTKATYPEDKLVSSISTADGKSYYAETKIGELEQSYQITSGGITPVPPVSDIEGSQLMAGKDYDVRYFKDGSPEPLEKVTEGGYYSLRLLGNGSKTFGGESAKDKFEAEAKFVQSVTLNKYEATLSFEADKDKVQLEALVLPVTASNKNVTWMSSNESVATVSEDGLVTAQGIGDAVITAAAEDDPEITDTCTISVVMTDPQFIVTPSKNILTYNESEQQLLNPGTASGGTVVYSKLVNGAYGEFSEEIPTGKDAGDYWVKYKILGDEHHNDTAEYVVYVSIAKAPGNIAVKKQHSLKTGSGDFDLSQLVGMSGAATTMYSIYGTDDTGSSVSGKWFTPGSAGTCTVKVTIDGRDNYLRQEEYITITIEQKDIQDVNVTMGSWTYGEAGEEPVHDVPQGARDLTIMYSGIKRSGDTYADINNKPQDAGLYQVYVWAEDDNNIYLGSTSFSIYPKSIAGAEVTLGSELTYTGEELEQTISKVMLGSTDITVFCRNGGNYAADGEYDPEEDLIQYTVVNAGAYNMVVTADETSSYTGSVVKEFTVAKADLTEDDYTAPAAVEGLVYDGTEHVLVEPGTARNGVITYSLNGSQDFSEKLPAGTGAGTYEVSYQIRGDANHNDISGDSSISVTIEKAECTMGAEPSPATGLEYTGENKELVSAGTSPDGDILYRVGDDDDAEFSAEVPEARDAGEYEVYYKVAARDDNHKDGEVQGPVSVVTGKKQGRVTGAPQAAEDLVYDGEEHALVEGGETNGCEMLYSLEEDGEYTDAVPTAENAGEYEVWYKAGGNENFIPSGEKGHVTVTVSKAPFPGSILRGAVSAGFAEDVDITALVSSDMELEYSINADQTDHEDCSIENGILRTGTGEGRCYIDIKAVGTENYETGSLYVNISDIEWTDIGVYQDHVTYGKEAVDPKYDEYMPDDDEEVSPMFTYRGTLMEGSEYGVTEEEYSTAPTEAGTYSVDVFYMIGDNAYFGTTEFSIRPADIGDAVVTLGSEIKYNGEEQTQEVAKVELDGEDITELCEVTDNKATDAGNYELTLTPKKETFNYSGSARVKFIVYPDDETLSAAKAAALKELDDKYDLSDYTGNEKAAVEQALAEASAAIGEARTLDDIDAAKASAEETISANKKDNTITAKGRKIKARFSKLKKKALRFKRSKGIKVTAAAGTVTYKRVSVKGKKSLLKQAKKKITVAKNGNIVLKKGLKKGTYKVRIKVSAAGNRYYKAGTRIVTVTIKVS